MQGSEVEAEMLKRALRYHSEEGTGGERDGHDYDAGVTLSDRAGHGRTTALEPRTAHSTARMFFR